MIKNPVVFIAQDYIMEDNLEEISQSLREKGVRVIRGPMPVPGTVLKYKKEEYDELFSEANVMMFSSRSICDEGVIDAGKRLIGIINPTCGMDTVNTTYATNQGIIIGNGPNPGNAVAESIFGQMGVLYASMNLTKHAKNSPTSIGGDRNWLFFYFFSYSACYMANKMV